MNTEAQRARNARKRRKLREKRKLLRQQDPSLRKRPPERVWSRHVLETTGIRFWLQVEFRSSRLHQQVWLDYKDLFMDERYETAWLPVKFRGVNAWLKLDRATLIAKRSRPIIHGVAVAQFHCPLLGVSGSTRVKFYNYYAE